MFFFFRDLLIAGVLLVLAFIGIVSVIVSAEKAQCAARWADSGYQYTYRMATCMVSKDGVRWVPASSIKFSE